MILEDEMRSEKFKNLAEKRVNNAIKNINLIGNLANTSYYEYNDEQINKIFAVLKKELDTAQMKFKARPQETAGLFTL